MKIKPVVTEKSLKNVQNGKYTFLFPANVTKAEIKKAINEMFSVHTKSVKTITKKPTQKVNLYGKKSSTKGYKKAIVTLKDNEKITIFEEATK